MRRVALVFLSALVFSVFGPPRSARAQDVDPSLLTITAEHGGLDAETGFLRIAGEIRNGSEDWIRAVHVDVYLFDPYGRSIAVRSDVTAARKNLGLPAVDGVAAERYFVPPGDVTPFEYVRDAKKLGGATYGSYQLVVRARGTVPPPVAAIENFRYDRIRGPFYSVAGRIRNTGNLPCRSPQVVVAVYDKDSTVWHVVSLTPEETADRLLAPRAAVPFLIKALEDPGGDTILSMKAWGDCAPAD